MNFPYELSLAIKGLDNKHRQKIITLLKDKEKLSFSEIHDELSLSRSLLASHLKMLSNNLLVEHYYEHEIGSEKFSFYGLTSFAKTLLDNMLGTLYFKKTHIKVKCMVEIDLESTTTSSTPLEELKEKVKTVMVGASERKRESAIWV